MSMASTVAQAASLPCASCSRAQQAPKLRRSTRLLQASPLHGKHYAQQQPGLIATGSRKGFAVLQQRAAATTCSAQQSSSQHRTADGSTVDGGVATLRQGATAALAAAALAVATTGPALAFGPVSVPFNDVKYEQVACSDGTFASYGGAISIRSGVACVKFTASAENPDKKALNNADVFGRVFDASGNGVTDVSENNRIAYVDLVPPGKSEVSFVLTMPQSQFDLGKLTWQGLKASGFTGKILPGQAGLTGLLGDDECALDSDPQACEDERAAMAAIR